MMASRLETVRWYFVASVMAVGSFGVGCGEDAEPNPSGGGRCPDVPADVPPEVHDGETITSPTNWDEDFVHRVQGTVLVAGGDGAQLSIDDCARVEFAPGAALVVGEGGAGRLVARGRSSAPLQFVAAEAEPWVGVRFGPGTSELTSFEYVSVQGAGAPSGRPEGDAAVLAWGDDTGEPVLDLIGLSVVGSASNGVLLSRARFGTDSVDLSVTGVAGVPLVADAAAITDAPETGTFEENGTNAYGVLGGVLSQRATWRPTALPYLVLADLFVEGDGADEPASLTLGPGVEVRFADDAGLRIGETLPGTFVATSTLGEPIVLTTADGTGSPRGGWRGILFGAEAVGVQMQSVRMYGAGGDFDGEEAAASVLARGVGDGRPVIEFHDLQIETSAGVGLALLAGARLEAKSSYLAVRDSASHVARVDAAAVGTLPYQVVDEGNDVGGILVDAGTIAEDSEWRVRDSPYVIDGPVVVEGASAPRLRITEGATLRFREDASLEVGRTLDGDVRAAGTSDLPIVFTADAGPTPGGWVGILLLAGVSNDTVFSKAIVEYAGGENGFAEETCGSSDRGNIVIVGTPAEFVGAPSEIVHDSILRGSAGYGIALDRAVSADLTAAALNEFEANALGEQTPPGC